MKRKPLRVTQADYLALGRALARDMDEFERIEREREAKMAHEKRVKATRDAFMKRLGSIL